MKYLLYSLGLLLMSCDGDTQNEKRQKALASIFIEHFSEYKIDIQAAGVATIPAASFKNDTLMIKYAYFSEGEHRKGKMSLIFKAQTGRFEGNWQTKADNGNIYKGSLYFTFNEKGKETGKYNFENSDYKITLLQASR
ncbi:MAG: hypothetical protein ACFB0B_19260 [Thermonemataceae bacterium]